PTPTTTSASSMRRSGSDPRLSGTFTRPRRSTDGPPSVGRTSVILYEIDTVFPNQSNSLPGRRCFGTAPMARQVNFGHRSLRSYLPIATSSHLYLLDLITYIACRHPPTGLERSMLNYDFRSNRSRSRLSDLKAHKFDRHVALVTFR